MMQVAVSVAYNSAALEKAALGCGSPMARGAEPHPARFAAFLFLSSFYGGSNGEAQASPVTLRVPRSSTPVRAAALCGSGSAVVHQAQLEHLPMAHIPPRLARACLSQDYILAVVGKAQAGHQMVHMGQQTIAESEAALQAIYLINMIMEEARRVDIKPAKRARKGGV